LDLNLLLKALAQTRLARVNKFIQMQSDKDKQQQAALPWMKNAEGNEKKDEIVIDSMIMRNKSLKM
jgi:hypothetical protein